MNWNIHIENLCKRVYQASYALYNLNKVANSSAVILAYHGYVALCFGKIRQTKISPLELKKDVFELYAIWGKRNHVSHIP